jgi:hypothetical protein
VGKPEGKRPLGRPRHRWVDNIKIDLSEHDTEPSSSIKAGKFLSSCTIGGFSRTAHLMMMMMMMMKMMMMLMIKHCFCAQA